MYKISVYLQSSVHYGSWVRNAYGTPLIKHRVKWTPGIMSIENVYHMWGETVTEQHLSVTNKHIHIETPRFTVHCNVSLEFS